MIHGYAPTEKVFSKVGNFYFVRFPLEVPSSLQQFNRSGVPFGRDLDRDDMEEKADVTSIATVVGIEHVNVPVGYYSEALLLDFKVDITVYLSRNGEQLKISTTGRRWYGKNIGLLKEVKRITMPAINGVTEEYVAELTEELASFRIAP